jgi:hypothetical protein
MNPTIGSGMQQARDSQQVACKGDEAATPVTGRTAEQAGEVVRNHEVGTWFGSGRPAPEETVATSNREWTPESMSMEGR